MPFDSKKRTPEERIDMLEELGFTRYAYDWRTEHLDDAALTVEAYAREVGLSRAQLHRKLKALTDLGPREFIRSHRLQRGAELLRGRYGNVTEVAYSVGFKNPSHFARCFREQFGIAPSAFNESADADSNDATP